VALEPTGARFALSNGEENGSTTVGLQFLGANGDATLRAEGPAVSHSNYFRGPDAARWITSVPNFERLTAENLYQGIDAHYYSQNGQLEYDLTLAAHTDPGAIQLGFSGVESLALDAAGDLILHSAAGDLVQHAPLIYQDGPAGRTTIAGRYALLGDQRAGLQIDAHDPSRPLVIDPLVVYANTSSLGSNRPTDIAVDAGGQAYVTGEESTGFSGTTDAFVSALSADGSSVLFTSYYGGSGNETGPHVALGAGGVVLAGRTASTDLPTLNAFQSSNAGGDDAFVAKFDASSGVLLGASYLGGAGNDAARDVAVNASGQIVVAGETNSSNFPTAGALQGALAGGKDGFVAKLSASLSTLVASTYAGGSADDSIAALALGPGGDVFVAGTTSSRDLAASANAFAPSYGGGDSDGFLARYSSTLDAATYRTYLGGAGADEAPALAVDSENSAYVTGRSTSPDYPTVNPYQSRPKNLDAAGDQVFVTKVNPQGAAAVYSTLLGGSAGQQGLAIGVDAQGRATVAGATGSSDFPQVNPLAAPYGSNNGAFLARLDARGQGLLYSTNLGGTGVDQVKGLAVDSQGNAYLAGTTQNFMSTQGTVAKVAPTLSPNAAVRLTGLDGDSGASAFDLVTQNTTPTLRGVAPPSTGVRVRRADGTLAGTTTSDASGNWVLALSAALPEGVTAFTADKDAPFGLANQPSPPLLVTVDQTAPTVTVETSATTTSTRPEVRVRVEDLNLLPDGTPVTLDGDWNNDGNYTDPGETGALTAQLRNGTALVTLPETALGSVNVRARVQDLAGNEGSSASAAIQVVASGNPWQMTAVARSWDVFEGNPRLQSGAAQTAVDLDLDQSPGRDAGLNPQLVYSSDGVDVRPVIQATLPSDNTRALPPVLRAQLTFGGVTFAEQDFSTAGFSPGQDLTLAVRVPTPITATGRYLWSLQVVADYPGTADDVTRTASGMAFAVSRQDSVFGPGWTFSGVDLLVPIAAQGSEPAARPSTPCSPTAPTSARRGIPGSSRPSSAAPSATTRGTAGWTTSTPAAGSRNARRATTRRASTTATATGCSPA
jgi:hypothetical protein